MRAGGCGRTASGRTRDKRPAAFSFSAIYVRTMRDYAGTKASGPEAMRASPLAENIASGLAGGSEDGA